MRSQFGLTAIEVLISLVLLSMVAAFSLHALEYSRRIYLETEQVEFCAQTARNILSELMMDPDWRKVCKRWEQEPIPACSTEFNIQFEEQGNEEEGVAGLELTISWVGPRGAQSRVFSTTVFDSSGKKEQ